VFTPGYFRDAADRVFAPRESAVLMAAASGAPIYSPFSTFIGTGIVGGRMPTYIEMGRQAAKAVNALLDGTAPAAVGLPTRIPAEVQIDWRQARRWGVDPNNIPSGAILHFKEPSFWEAHRDAVIITAAVLLLQAGLITALLIERQSRRRTAMALEASQKQMNLAARAARLSTWAWDVGRIENGAAESLRQHAAPQNDQPMAFEHVLETTYPADRADLERAVGKALATGEELDIEYRVLRPDGDVRWVAARGRVEKGNASRLLGVALDVTERKVANLQAAQDRAALRHMTRVSIAGQLSAAIAHQINQPLAAILGNAEAAQKMLASKMVDLADLREICDDIVTEEHRAAEVIRRLSALYKRGDMKVAPLDLNELIRETLELLRTELLIRHVAPLTDLAPALPVVDGGHVQLQQVLLNLILNAADAMNGNVEERKLTIRTEATGAVVRFYVVDNGCGIAADDLKNVFDAFWTTKAAGMGMGLAICKSIIAAHHGSITATNNVEGGAAFCVSLPSGKPA